MKALILAAGLGTRLAPITDKLPKALVPVNGKPIIIKQMENLYENGITDITVISGYKADILESEVKKSFPSANIVFNGDYASTNNMYSAYLGEKYINGESFLMMNSDVFFDSTVIRSLIDCTYENAIVTDVGVYMEESMKVVEKDGRLVKISKQITEQEAFGTSIDVYKFSSKGGRAFFDMCDRYINELNELKMWSEVALNDILGETEFFACPLVGRWFEIDNHDDLKAAERMFAGE